MADFYAARSGTIPPLPWSNFAPPLSLCTYGELLQAPLLVCGFTYQKGLYEDHAVATAAYAPELAPYMIHNQLQITPELLLVADANVLPTTANPLSGWHDANDGNHVIVPSARIAFESIPRLQNDPPRYIASTGCVTIPSYTPRAAGRKAIHKHTYGATLVEIDSDGEVFIHPIFAAEDGSFQHLDRIIDGDDCTLGNPVDVMVLGDIHLDQIDPIIAMTAIGYDASKKQVVTDACLRGQLRPKNLVLHDLIDGLHFNPHNRNDVHEKARIRASSPSTVEDEVMRSANFVNEITFDGCFTHVIQSNHDNFLARYLQDKDGALDPVNAYYWHRLNWIWHDEIRKGHGDFFNVVHEALRISGMQDHVNFIAYGEDLRINGIDYSLHGDRGTGGSKGGKTQFSRLAFKNTTAHGHHSWIFGKGFGAGTFSKLYMHYNKGLTRSCHSCVVGFSNGQQGLITINPDGRYQATGDITNRSQRAA